MTPTRRTTLALQLALVVAALAAFGLRAPRPAFAWAAGGALLPNGSAQGFGQATTTSSRAAQVQISLTGARANATYAIFSCLSLFGGDFGCVERTPPTVQAVNVAPRGIAPVVVTLVDQGTLQTDANGNASMFLPLVSGVYPDMPRSIYNVVQLVDTADATDSYTALDIQPPVAPVAGVNAIFPISFSLVLGVPVYVLAQFPGFVYPVAITPLTGYPFVPYLVVPGTVFGGYPFGATVGVCPTGLPPQVQAGPGGILYFVC